MPLGVVVSTTTRKRQQHCLLYHFFYRLSANAFYKTFPKFVVVVVAIACICLMMCVCFCDSIHLFDLLTGWLMVRQIARQIAATGRCIVLSFRCCCSISRLLCPMGYFVRCHLTLFEICFDIFVGKLISADCLYTHSFVVCSYESKLLFLVFCVDFNLAGCKCYSFVSLIASLVV